jgi:hypothetical protein
VEGWEMKLKEELEKQNVFSNTKGKKTFVIVLRKDTGVG